ncbi:MAG: type I DNA topoisomerase [Candidatus Zixiibacteriota bacterium]|nr:MAG: type I DNA topoisomerase [candidate division Zixibacteria bacterium]
MAKNVVIVESPAKCRTLARFLGKDYDIVSTVGHIIDLPKSRLGVDVENDFEPDYTIIKGKEKVIKELKKAAKGAGRVFLAPDPDREGEAIAWHVANTLKSSKADFCRVTFNEITKSAVTEAMARPGEIDANLVNAQQARRILDRLVGYKVSPFLWSTVARNLSAGRVQSVALRLICEREDEIRAFKSREYWNISAILLTSSRESFKANLYKIDGKTVVKAGEKGRTKIVLTSKEEADRIVADLKTETFTVSDVKKSTRSRRPSAPFITSTLQQEAAKVLNMSPKQTMAVAQKLYEGIEIGQKGPTGLITYMRTDSTRVAKEALSAVRTFIAKEYGKDYVPAKPNVFGKRKTSQDAHEAIRPTYLDLPPARVRKHLTPQQFKLYSLIWKRFVASQMNPAKLSISTVEITAGQYLFRASVQNVVFDGFLKLYQEAREPDENGNGNGIDSLPPLNKGDQLAVEKLIPTQSFTKPPPRYSEAMLVKRLEADGIGRPSTYATIVATLKDRKYVQLTERKLHPSELGVAVSGILVEHFPEIFNVAFTANMERELDAIEDGQDDWVKVVKGFYGPFVQTLELVKGKQSEIKASLTEETDEVCPKCGEKMLIKWGRNGRFLACSGWPDCKSTRPLPEEEAKNRTDEKCEKCGADMIIKTGRFGRFMACSAYPDCRNTKPIKLGVKCPKEGCGGDLIEKQSRNKRLFFGCSNYPKCDFASWDRPVNRACPVCKHPFMLHKVSKARGEHLKCPGCKHLDAIEGPAAAASEDIGVTT